MMRTGQSCKEASARKRSLANPKKKVRVGCWNVKTLFSTGRTAQVMKEMRTYKIGKFRKVENPDRRNNLVFWT